MEEATRMPQPVLAAGYLIFCRKPSVSFLLMKHANRWDLPKGRLDPGETIEQAAMRELCEETGFLRREIEPVEEFRFTLKYELPAKKGQKPRPKELTIFLGWMEEARTPILTEHEGFAWFHWNPPHSIQSTTIDPLLTYTHKFFLHQTAAAARGA